MEAIVKEVNGRIELIYPGEVNVIGKEDMPITTELLERYEGDFIIDASLLPDRYFRDALVVEGKSIVIDVDLARSKCKKKKEAEFTEAEKILTLYPSLRDEFEKNKSKLLNALDTMSLEQLKGV